MPVTRKLRLIVGNQLRQYRQKLRLSQSDLGLLTGLHKGYLGSVERGERNIGIDNLEKIAFGLGVEPWRLLYDPQQRSKHETSALTED